MNAVGLGYRYPSGDAPALVDVTAAVAPGQRVLVAGRSGSGKSTLLRLAAGLAGRFGGGTVLGGVTVDGRDPAAMAPRERCGALGLVTQDPGDQLVTGRVDDEVAFPLESLGWAADRIAPRVRAVLDQLRLDVAPDRAPGTLSGGQQQRLVVAATLAGGAPLLLLDEPLALLDPAGARELLAALAGLAARGVAVVLAEHRLDLCWDWCDRVWVLDRGRLVCDAVPDAVSAATLRAHGLQVPDRLAAASPGPVPPRLPVPPRGRRLVAVSELSWAYDDVPALHGVRLEVYAGDRVALLGANGAGKSTLLRALGGALPAGIRVDGRVLDVPQDPDLSLFSDTVLDELAYGPAEAGVPDARERATAMAGALGLDTLLDRPPQGLSRGERLRVAVGAALTCRPDLLLLDEPTAGQDRAHVEALLAALAPALAEGAWVMATHDVALALRHATRVLVLDAGRIVAEGTPAEVLAAWPGALPLPWALARCAERGLPPMSADELA